MIQLVCIPSWDAREDGIMDLTYTRRFVRNSMSASSKPKDEDCSLDMGMLMMISSVACFVVCDEEEDDDDGGMIVEDEGESLLAVRPNFSKEYAESDF